MQWRNCRTALSVGGVIFVWIVQLLCSLLLYVGFTIWEDEPTFPGPREVPDDINAEYLDGLHESWKTGKILYRKRVDVLGHPIVFDIVEDYDDVDLGFAPVTLPVKDLYVNAERELYVYLETIKQEKCLFATIGPKVNAVRLK